MGGLRKQIPFTFWVFLIGCARRWSRCPGTSGFCSQGRDPVAGLGQRPPRPVLRRPVRRLHDGAVHLPPDLHRLLRRAAASRRACTCRPRHRSLAAAGGAGGARACSAAASPAAGVGAAAAATSPSERRPSTRSRPSRCGVGWPAWRVAWLLFLRHAARARLRSRTTPSARCCAASGSAPGASTGCTTSCSCGLTCGSSRVNAQRRRRRGDRLIPRHSARCTAGCARSRRPARLRWYAAGHGRLARCWCWRWCCCDARTTR